MKKNILLLGLAGASIISLASCNNGTTSTTNKTNTTTSTADTTTSTETTKSTVSNTTISTSSTTTTEAKDINYTVTVKDIDGEVLIDNLALTSKEGATSIIDDIKNAGYEVEGYDSDYGFYLTSIAGSIVDSNYYLAFYVNENSASTGASSYKIQDGDKIEFKVECFNIVEYGGKLDATDVLVDKIIYSYVKNQMPELIANDTTYASSDFWTYMTINALNDNFYNVSYDTSIIKADLKNSIEQADLSSLSGANFGKYYWTAKALGYDLEESFVEAYQTHLNSISTTYSQYVTPFEIAPAYGLELTSDNLKTLVKDAQLASTQYGIDALAWQVASLAPYEKYNYTMLNLLNTRNLSNCTSNALQLIDFAAFNVDPRSGSYDVDGKDLVEYIIENFYDEEANLVKVYPTDEGINMSTNQVYAGLVSYKIQRDTNKAFYLFA